MVEALCQCGSSKRSRQSDPQGVRILCPDCGKEEEVDSGLRFSDASSGEDEIEAAEGGATHSHAGDTPGALLDALLSSLHIPRDWSFYYTVQQIKRGKPKLTVKLVAVVCRQRITIATNITLDQLPHMGMPAKDHADCILRNSISDMRRAIKRVRKERNEDGTRKEDRDPGGL